MDSGAALQPIDSTASEGRADFVDFHGVGAHLREAHRAYAKALQDLLAQEGVSASLWYFLCKLWEEDGLSQKELCHRVGAVEATAVNVLGQMEQRGWIVRDRDPKDQRRRVVFLTEAGHAMQRRLEPVHAFLEQSDVIGLNQAEILQLKQLTERVVRRLEDKLNRAPAPASLR
jgi:DNA-binding MarR family transcriptional regulator